MSHNQANKKSAQPSSFSAMPPVIEDDSPAPHIIAPQSLNVLAASSTHGPPADRSEDAPPVPENSSTSTSNDNQTQPDSNGQPTSDIDFSATRIPMNLSRSVSDPSLPSCRTQVTLDNDYLPHLHPKNQGFREFLESNPSAPWHMAFQQLKAMGGRMSNSTPFKRAPTH